MGSLRRKCCNYILKTMADSKDAYIAALEKKLHEISGIEVEQIRKNQISNAQSEADAIKEMSEYVANITIQSCGTAKAGIVDPQIAAIYQHINAELGESRGAHALPPLKYEFAGLEPHISAMIMEIHHTKHHQGYINNLIAATKKLEEAEAAKDNTAINALLPAIKFNGGGHPNHTIFWTNMAPNAGVKGSGWGWLGYCPKGDKVAVATCQNQDGLQVTRGLVPLLGIDVWEHAYYLQYKNLRPAYVAAFFNVINWTNVNERYENARKAAGH